MSKKRSKGEMDSQGEQVSNQKKEQFFQCKCGKKYGSLAAVHTHINNKHNSQKKQYKIAIKNPKKTGQGPSTSIRMKDIAYNEQQADLMCTADTTLKNIYDYMKRQNVKAEEFLLDQNVIDSCEELDQDDDEDDIGLIPRPKGKRDKEINELVIDLKKLHQVQEINHILQQPQQFKAFKIDKFKLNMKKQLIKFFNHRYAGLIQLELQIIAAKSRIKNNSKNKRLQEKLCSTERQMWGNKIEIVKQLESYYSEWIRLRKKEYKGTANNR